MLTEEELRFIEKELRNNGVIFESVEQLVQSDPKVIFLRCADIIVEESELSGGVSWDESGNQEEYDAHPQHDVARANMAEEIYETLYSFVIGS